MPSEATATLQLYPNPVASGQPLTLEMAGYDTHASVTVYNLLGMKISTTHAANGANSVAVPATAGVYLVKITGLDGALLQTERVVVK